MVTALHNRASAMGISLKVFLIDNRFMLILLNRVYPRLSLKIVVDVHSVYIFLLLIYKALRTP